jgi:hypothetical protein
MSENPKETGTLPPSDPPVCEPVCEKPPDSAQPGTPSEPDGPPDGREAARSAQPAPTAAQLLAGLPPAPLAAPDAPTAPPDAVRAALVGEPDAATDLRWCRKCAAMVRPIGKGRCERCNAFLKLNFSARKHPVNVLRRDALLAELNAEYAPATTMQRSTCAHLAGTLEQLEMVKPGSPDWQRLVQVAQTLGAALDATRGAPRPQTPDDYQQLSDEQLHARLEALLHDSAAHIEAKKRGQTLVAEAAAGLRAREREAAGEIVEPVAPGEPAKPDAPIPVCQFCMRPLTICETSKDADLDTWRVIHSRDPREIERRKDEAARRDKEATAAMLRPDAGLLPAWYRR